MNILSEKTKHDRIFAYLLLVPALLVISIIIIIPLIEAIGFSFTKISLISLDRREFVGLHNFKRLAADPTYWQVLTNTIFIVFTSVLFSLFVGLGLALALNKYSGNGLIKGLLIIPWLLPGVVIGILWKWILATEAGIVNFLLRRLGLIESNLAFLSDETLSPWIVILVFVWASVPYILVTTLAGLQAVPSELEEAAMIDGANYVQNFKSVILPVLTPILSIAVVLRIIYTMQDFAIIFSLTQGGPGSATETFVITVYKTAFNSAQIGYACAIGVTWLILLLVFVLTYFRLMHMNEKRLYS